MVARLNECQSPLTGRSRLGAAMSQTQGERGTGKGILSFLLGRGFPANSFRVGTGEGRRRPSRVGAQLTVWSAEKPPARGPDITQPRPAHGTGGPALAASNAFIPQGRASADQPLQAVVLEGYCPESTRTCFSVCRTTILSSRVNILKTAPWMNGIPCVLCPHTCPRIPAVWESRARTL